MAPMHVANARQVPEYEINPTELDFTNSIQITKVNNFSLSFLFHISILTNTNILQFCLASKIVFSSREMGEWLLWTYCECQLSVSSCPVILSTSYLAYLIHLWHRTMLCCSRKRRKSRESYRKLKSSDRYSDRRK